MYLPTALFLALRPLFPFQQVQYVQVFVVRPAPFCTLFAGPSSANESATSLLFSSYMTLVLFSPACPLLHFFYYLKHSGRSGRNCLLSPHVLLSNNGSMNTRLSQIPSVSIEKPVLPRHARCVLSRLRCNGHSLLIRSFLSKFGKIENPSCSACGHSSQDTSNLILHCPTTDFLCRSLFGDPLSLYDLWSRPWGVSRFLELHGLPPCSHPPEGVG